MRNSAVNADASVAHYSRISGLLLCSVCVTVSSWTEGNSRAWPAWEVEEKNDDVKRIQINSADY